MAKIFVSYRRDDDPSAAARVRDALAARFGKANIFMDVDNLLAGLRFDEELAKALAACDVFIAIIGVRWMDLLTAKAASSERDYVCEEIAEALKRKIAVIPVRVGRDGQLAPLPRGDDLPPAIRDLVHYQKHDVAHEHFGRDANALAEAIIAVRRHLGPTGGSAVPPVPWRWIGATAASVLGIGYVGAYYVGVPVPWPGSPASVTGPSVAESAAAEKKRLDDLAAQVVQEREARTKAEAETKRLADAAAQTKREQDARLKAESDAAVKAKAEDDRKRAEAEAKRAAAEQRQRDADAEAAAKAKAEADRAQAAALAKQRADEEAARRDPLLALTPGSGQAARDRLANGQPCPTCPEMVVAPAGSFTMGSTASEIAALTKESPFVKDMWRSEAPQRRVTIAGPIAVGKFAVTRGEFGAFISETGHKTDGGCYTLVGSAVKQQADKSWRSTGFEQTDRHPVVCVNWDDAKAYAVWLSAKTGKSYRLLSEAEREYVTRAGTTTAFWWGPSISTRQANYNGDHTFAGSAKGEYRKKTMPVDSFEPNPWGLYQVHGNVFDWTEDCWHATYQGAPSDGSAWTTACTESGRRVVRGGSWDFTPDHLRSAFRFRGTPSDLRRNLLGFRVGRTLTP